MTTDKTFFDKLAAKADELELQRKAEEFVDAAAKLAHSAVERAGGYTHDNLGKVEGILDKAAAKVDEQTDGKYHDKVVKARAQASKGVAKLAEQRGTQTGGEAATGGTAATGTGGAATGGTAATGAGAAGPTEAGVTPDVTPQAPARTEPWAQATDVPDGVGDDEWNQGS